MLLKWLHERRDGGAKIDIERFFLEPSGGDGRFGVNFRVTNRETRETVILEEGDTVIRADDALDDLKRLGVEADPLLLRPAPSMKYDAFLRYLATKGVDAAHDPERGRYRLTLSGPRGKGETRIAFLYAPRSGDDQQFEQYAWVGMVSACQALDLPIPREFDAPSRADYVERSAVVTFINNNNNNDDEIINNNNNNVETDVDSSTGAIRFYDPRRDSYETGSRDNPVVIAAEDREGDAIRPSEAQRTANHFGVTRPMPVAPNLRPVVFGAHRLGQRGLGEGVAAASRYAREISKSPSPPNLDDADAVEIDWLRAMVDANDADRGDGEHETAEAFRERIESEEVLHVHGGPEDPEHGKDPDHGKDKDSQGETRG